MTIDAIIEGMQIVSRHSKDRFCVCAEHDIIYCGLPEGMPEADVARMKELGWFVDDSSDSWACYP